MPRPIRAPKRTPTPSDHIERLLDHGVAQMEAQMGDLLAAYAVRWYWDGCKLVAEPLTYEEVHDAQGS